MKMVLANGIERPVVTHALLAESWHRHILDLKSGLCLPDGIVDSYSSRLLREAIHEICSYLGPRRGLVPPMTSSLSGARVKKIVPSCGPEPEEKKSLLLGLAPSVTPPTVLWINTS